MLAVPDSVSFRVCVIGDSSVGKTAILNRLIDQKFNLHDPPTINANYQIYVAELGDARVEMQIWDTAGQEKFRSLGPIYFRNAVGAIAVYDQTQRTSFEHLSRWIRDFTEVAGPGTSIAIAANKNDLTDFEVQFTEAQDWAREQNFIIAQTSAKTGEGIEALFSLFARELVKNQTRSAPNKRKKAQPVENTGGGCSC